jgi:hypothetical protein
LSHFSDAKIVLFYEINKELIKINNKNPRDQLRIKRGKRIEATALPQFISSLLSADSPKFSNCGNGVATISAFW